VKKSSWVFLAIGVLLIAVPAYLWWTSAMPWAARRALADAEQYELMSLDPAMGSGLMNPPSFHGYRVLGSTPVTDPGTRQRLNDALLASVDEATPSDRKSCFQPRHGVRVSRGGTVTEFLICFQCWSLRVFRDGQPIAAPSTTDSAQATFSEVLRQAEVPLSPK
jgi:hypothetical protein